VPCTSRGIADGIKKPGPLVAAGVFNFQLLLINRGMFSRQTKRLGRGDGHVGQTLGNRLRHRAINDAAPERRLFQNGRVTGRLSASIGFFRRFSSLARASALACGAIALRPLGALPELRSQPYRHGFFGLLLVSRGRYVQRRHGKIRVRSSSLTSPAVDMP